MRATFSVIRFKGGGKSIEQIILTAEFREEAGEWLAECLELGTATYGSTLKVARKELTGAVLLQLNQVEQMGFSKEFLADHGVHPSVIRPPKSSSSRKASWAAPVAAAV